ncbi:MAG: glycosyltransferase [Verrucomicrobiota bacterium]
MAHLARWGKVPSCFLCHNVIPHEHSMVDRILLRYAFSAGKAFVTHSQEDADNLKLLRPDAPAWLNPHPTYDVFAGAEPPSREEARTQLDLSEKKVLLFFGYIRKYKGLAVLLEAMKRLPADEGFHLLIVGEFYDDKSQYQDALDNLSNQITLVDRYVGNDEVPLYFSACDLVAAPYLTATQSGVIQIAYGFTRPVVASAVGGIPEAVVEGRTGYLVPPSDPEKLADAIRVWFSHPDPASVDRHIQEEQKKYSWERMVETIETMAGQLTS